ncbi:MAG: HEAT repeat domain-containing protein [Verrucomicrobia bacterium]|nr:HEAT repeat domain-containing protein [Verrucomicrobiota bacterium]
MWQPETVPALTKVFFVCLLWSACQSGWTAEHQVVKDAAASPPPAAATDAELAIKRFTVAPGLKVEVFAAEPHLANPVAFCFDECGRCYVAETFRLGAGVTDIRGHVDWLDEDLACRTPDDRLAMMKRHLGSRLSDYAEKSDQVRLLEDRDGDGRVEHSTVFASGFNHLLDGLGSGVLARNGDVWFANIPHLWLLRDTDGDGVADVRRSLHYGYGVRFNFIGHDLHGLRFGPDGKLYFTIGDRGANVSSTINHHSSTIPTTDTGCVFRCNADGSELEVFAFGLRNPQELAFDQYGNLFTGDNNSDGGDRARWVYLVEGGDSGWRVGYQWIDSPNSRGPWNAEKMWHPQNSDQPAFLVPPVANIAAGPSGTTYYPGTGLPERFAGHFFLADFHGDAGSTVRAFALKPVGASFELVEAEPLVKGLLATDVEFGVNGGVYVSDWVQGWGPTGKGRIYRFHDPAVDQTPLVRETQQLLREGMTKRSLKELARLLAHADTRVRQEAQFELAARGEGAIKTLAEVAQRHRSRLARLHAIWGLGQISNFKFQIFNFKSVRSQPLDPLLPLLRDPDTEVRAQAAKVLGDARHAKAYDALVALLRDASPRVRFFAALSLGKLGRTEALPSILALLRENADADPLLRHGGVMALLWIDDLPAVLAAAKDESAAVRLAALLALRRLERAEIATFLHDPDSRLVLEAARAINDLPISGALPELAALLDFKSQISNLKSEIQVPLLRRALNAAFRHGTRETAAALAQFAARADAPEAMRADALTALGDWPTPSGRDRITSLWRPLAARRDTKVPAEALRPAVVELLHTAPDSVRIAAARAANRLALAEAAPALLELVRETRLNEAVRVAALKGLPGLNPGHLTEALKLAAADTSELLRKEATRLAAHGPSSDAIEHLAAALEGGTVAEKQSALATLATLNSAAAEETLSQWSDDLLADKVPPALQLDLLEALAAHPSQYLKEQLAKYEAARPKDDPLAGFRECLHGGDAKAGRQIFFERPDAACLRCHKINGEGGEIGPDLTGVGARQKREYLLESMVSPNRQIAAGFDNLLVQTKSGAAYAGVLKNETAAELTLNSPEDGLVTIKQADIQSRDKGLSAMPEGLTNVLTKPDLRNLVEFLSGLK